MILFTEGDWQYYKAEGVDWGLCLRHTKGHGTEGMCACDGECAGCDEPVPDIVQGFFNLAKWSMTK